MPVCVVVALLSAGAAVDSLSIDARPARRQQKGQGCRAPFSPPTLRSARTTSGARARCTWLHWDLIRRRLRLYVGTTQEKEEEEKIYSKLRRGEEIIDNRTRRARQGDRRVDADGVGWSFHKASARSWWHHNLVVFSDCHTNNSFMVNTCTFDMAQGTVFLCTRRLPTPLILQYTRTPPLPSSLLKIPS